MNYNVFDKKILLFSPTGNVGERLVSIFKRNSINFYYIDRNGGNLRDDVEIDVCIYTAGVTSARRENTRKYVVDNLLTAIKVVDLCQCYKAKRIIYLSSDEVYGELKTGDLSAGSAKINLNSYAMTKLLSEEIITESDIRYLILRLPAIVGRNISGSSFLERITKRMIADEIVCCSNLSKKFNNVVDVDDLCDFIVDLAFSDEDYDSKILHLGQEESEPLVNILNYIKNKTKSNSKIYQEENFKRYFIMPVNEAMCMGYRSKGIYKIIDELLSI